jgi:peptidyl-tRNA hydrolase
MNAPLRPPPVPKLYVLVRADLPLGAQLAQAVHGMRQFTADHPEVDAHWFTTSNTVAVLHVRDEAHLLERVAAARHRDVPVAVFREPDLADAATVAVLGPGTQARRVTARLPLAG